MDRSLSLVVLLLFLVASCTNATTSQTDINVLRDIYSATSGNNWAYNCFSGTCGVPWNFSASPVDPCASDNIWFGLVCSDNGETVSTLDLDMNALDGTIPTSIGSFESIIEIDLAVNNIRGTIPSQLGLLTDLITLNIGYNELSGTLPDALGSLQRCVNFDVVLNSLRGSIPEGLYNMTRLENINLGINSLSGTLSSRIGHWTSATTMFMDGNMFTGSIPDTLTNFQNLTTLDLSDNLFNGSLPSSLMINPRLQYLSLADNCLSGSVPSTISAFNQSLTSLYLSLNLFTGLILSHLLTTETVLKTIDVSYNMFSGSIPSTAGNWVYLEYMYLYNNYFTGPIPPETAYMTQTTEMLLQYNFLSGPMPNVLVTGDFLQIFNCRTNFISGTIPSNIGYYGNLTSVDNTDNLFHGTLPYSVGNLQILALLSMSINRFSGVLPQSLGSLTSLVTLLLHSNYFSGTSGPMFASEYGSLEAFDISDNNFKGPLPDHVFKLPLIEVVSLARNCFTGTIPTNICSASNLQKLSMSGLSSGSNCIRPVFFPVSSGIYTSTYMQGSIPDCILQLPNLLGLEMSGNALTGVIPALPHDSRLVNLSLSHNRLKGTIPESFGPHFKFGVMDLSFNKIKGTVVELAFFNLSNASSITPPDIYTDDVFNLTEQVPTTSTQLFLEVNRLSGGLPGAFQNAFAIDILSGNYFQCPYFKDTLPENDPDYHHYSCGSSSLDLALFLNMFLFLAGISAVIAYAIHHNYQCMLKVNNSFYHSYCTCVGAFRHAPALLQVAFWDVFIYVSMLDSKVRLVRDIETLETRSLVLLYTELRGFAVRVALVLALLVMPVYVLVGHYYSTITYQYGWVVSAGFTTGFVPAVVYLFVWSCVLYAVYSLVYAANDRLNTFHTSNIEHYRTKLSIPGQPPLQSVYVYAHGLGDGSGGGRGQVGGVGVGSDSGLVSVSPQLEGVALSETNTGLEMAAAGGMGAVSVNPMHKPTDSTQTASPASGSVSEPLPLPLSPWHQCCAFMSGLVRYWTVDKLYLYIIVPVCNGIIVVLFNGMYVYAVITQSTFVTLLAQVGLVGFKTGWNQFCVPAMIKYARVLKPRCAAAKAAAKAAAAAAGGVSLEATNTDSHRAADDVDSFDSFDGDDGGGGDLFSRATLTTNTGAANGELASRFSNRWTFSATVPDPTGTGAAASPVGSNGVEGASGTGAGTGTGTGTGSSPSGTAATSTPHTMYSKHYRIQVLLLVFNNVIAPYFATAAADANCFLYLFVKPADIGSVYAYPECVYYTVHGCEKFSPSPPVVSVYTPPFIYMYQCSTSVIANYIPVFIFVYMYLGLLLPVWHYFNLYWALNRARLAAFTNDDADVDVELTEEELEARENQIKLKTYAGLIGSSKGYGLFKAPNTTCNLIGHLAVLLTFGVVYPPLGLIIALYVINTTYTWQSLLESLFSVCDFIVSDKSNNGNGHGNGTEIGDPLDPQATEKPELTTASIVCFNLELQCFGLYAVLHDSKELLIVGAGLFYSTVLLDMIGDNTVYMELLHLWVPACMVLMSMLISKNKVKLLRMLGLDVLLAYCWEGRLFSCNSNSNSNSSSSNKRTSSREVRNSTFEMTNK